MQQPPPPEPPPRPLPPQPLPWGYEPPQPPQPPRPWYQQPLGVFAIITGALLVIGLLANALNGGGQAPGPATTATPGATAPGATAPPATTAATTTTVPATLADRLGQAAQDELAAVGTITAVDAEPGGQVTVTWEIAEAATMGLTRNQARLGVVRIMRAVKQVEAGAGDDYQGVRLLGRFRPPGAAAPATVVRLRFSRATVQATEFTDFRYAEAYDLADAAVVDPAFRA